MDLVTHDVLEFFTLLLTRNGYVLKDARISVSRGSSNMTSASPDVIRTAINRSR